MATTTYDRHHVTTTQPQYRHDQHTGDRLTHPQRHEQGPSTGKIMVIMALLPITGILFGLAGITSSDGYRASLATPLFVIFSPVIVPAMIAIGLAVTGFLTSGTFGLTGLSSLSYLFNMVRRSTMSVPDQMDYVKGKLQDVGEYTGQKTKDLGQKIQHTAHEMGDQGQGQGQGGGKEGRKEGGK
uniref:Oleosin n=1 Tax=Helianthus annuus TaxID=4232 RepID=Q39952_HELAN|nr:oleosin [Helianthus annuus]